MSKYDEYPYPLNRESCYIGEPISSSMTGVPVAKTQNYLRNWQYNGAHFLYSGSPLTSLNPESGDFYIIHWGATKPWPTDRQYCVAFLPWASQTSTYSKTLKWRPLYNALASTDIDLKTETAERTITQDWYDSETSPLILASYGLSQASAYTRLYADTGTAAMTCSKLMYENWLPAAVAVWQIRPDDMGWANKVAKIVAEEDVATGSVVRGYEDSYRTGAQPSLGSLIEYIGDPSWGTPSGSDIDSIDMATRRCLFQHGHPAGYWTDQTDYNLMYGLFSPQIKLRNIYDSEDTDDVDVEIYPSVVVSGYGDIKIEITTDSDTYTATYNHASATTTLIQPGDFTGTLKAELGVINEVSVSIKATAASEFLVKTVSLWEGPGTPPA